MLLFPLSTVLCVANWEKRVMRNTLPTCQSFRRKTVYFTKQNVLLKQPIRIDYLIKEKPWGELAEIQERMRKGG